MRTLVTAITFLALLVAPAVAQAGPLCRVVGAALRGGKAAATAPFRVVGRGRANRSARGCN